MKKKIIFFVALGAMLSGMFLIDNTNISLLISCPSAIVAGWNIDSLFKKKKE